MSNEAAAAESKELAAYRATGLAPDEIQEVVDLWPYENSDIPAAMKRWIERCTWHVRKCDELSDALTTVTTEWNAALQLLHGTCAACKHYTAHHCQGKCQNCKWNSANPTCLREYQDDNWEWASPQNKNQKENAAMTRNWKDISRKSQAGDIFPEYSLAIPHTDKGEALVHHHIDYGDEYLLTVHSARIPPLLFISLDKVRLGTTDPEKAKQSAFKFITQNLGLSVGQLLKAADALQNSNSAAGAR